MNTYHLSATTNTAPMLDEAFIAPNDAEALAQATDLLGYGGHTYAILQRHLDDRHVARSLGRTMTSVIWELPHPSDPVATDGTVPEWPAHLLRVRHNMEEAIKQCLRDYFAPVHPPWRVSVRGQAAELRRHDGALIGEVKIPLSLASTPAGSMAFAYYPADGVPRDIDIWLSVIAGSLIAQAKKGRSLDQIETEDRGLRVAVEGGAL